MKLRLSELDRQAVDLLLDRSPSVEGNGATLPPPVVRPAGVDMNQNLQNVSAVFSLLSQLPSEDPPLDLVQRTLKRIDDASGNSLDDLMTEESLSDSGTFTL